jgi:hypothetical protein
LINEGINCLYEGLAGPEDINDTMKFGSNHPIRPAGARRPASAPT